MTQSNKNPLRQLATRIAKACEQDGAKRVKQTTVLKVLTADRGYRSIQCSDQQSPSKSLSPQTVFLQGLLYTRYEDSDLLGVDFNAIAGNALDPKEVGDFVFATVWNWLLSPQAMVSKLEVISGLETMIAGMVNGRYEQLLETNFINEQVRGTIRDLLGHDRYDNVNMNGWFDYIQNEAVEVAAQDHDTPKGELSTLIQHAIGRIWEDIDEIKWIFEENQGAAHMIRG